MRINNAFHDSRVGKSAYTFDNAVPKGKTSRKNASAFVSISGATNPSTFAFSMVCLSAATNSSEADASSCRRCDRQTFRRSRTYSDWTP